MNPRSHDAWRLAPVLNGRKERIRGLWVHDGLYYAQVRMDRGNGTTAPRRIRLKAATVTEAKAELESIRTRNRAGTLPAPALRPKLADAIRDYLASPGAKAKKPGTHQGERQALTRWAADMGGLRIDHVSAARIVAFRDARMTEGAHPRTATIDVIALRCVLRFCRDRALLDRLPEVPPLKIPKPERKRLLTVEELNRLLAACHARKADGAPVTKNGDLMRFYLRFLTLTGAREVEATKIRWADVDLAGGRVMIGAGGSAKNRETRFVEMSAELRRLLTEMAGVRPPDSSWLFPSPQRGERDAHVCHLRESLVRARRHAALPWVGFHHLRHFFISQAVMAGIDFLTIAAWVGHKDGGILIGKVYGHLNNEHRQRAAAKLSLLDQPTNIVALKEATS